MSLMYVLGSLPRLEFGAKPDITTHALILLFELNFSSSDREKVRVFKRLIDLQNLYRLLQKDDVFDERGNLPKATFRELIEEEEGLPAYVFEFISQYETDEERKDHFDSLIATYFRTERKKASGFVKEFLNFEYDLRIIIACFKAKKFGHDIGNLLKYEDSSEPIVQMALAQKDSPQPYVFPFEYRELETVVKEAVSSPIEQLLALAKYRFDYYQEIEYDFPFTLRRAIAYLMQLMQLEEIFALDKREGERQLMKLMENEDAL